MTPVRTPPWRRRLATTLAACTVLSALPAPARAQVRLPSLGETASQDLSVGAERRLGEQIMREARRDPAYLDDPVLLEYLQSIWSPLVAAARQLGNIDADTDLAFAWEPFLVRDRSVNAFALPGGFVGVHLGLIFITSTSDQLASVLAHEMSHVTQRHIARSIAPQQQASMLALATLLLGIIAASRTGNVDVANAAIMGGQGAAIQSQLNYSRDVEREADRIGFGVLVGAGYAPSAMAAMFDNLDASTRLNDNSGFPYLRSHPLTVDRISEARNRTLLANSAPAPLTLQHALMQARSRVLMSEGTRALQRLSGETSSPLLADRVAALYAGAMAASFLNDHARAEVQVAQALQLAGTARPREPRAERALQLLQAQVRLAHGDAPGAMQALDNLPPGASGRPVLLLRAQAALELHRRDAGGAAVPLRSSTEALQTWLAEQPHDALGWELLAATSDALGLKLRSMRAGAEARAVVGDLVGAVDRLRAAQAATRTTAGQDFIEASVIDARLRQLMAQRRQLALEARGESRRPGPGDEPPQ
ncbi:M48 family metalloprotease [Brevundimonas sp.]|uniref:M48 family metalloprotease n=1 Tax=Brevundimonas sp. TaxID=1871086 RepID=UPI0027314097|nr:M48 family metalloprotease [Brevundimonas sp.]MDP1912187.1 M48 family metalloprotease [Brevundimonas sp.]